MAAKQPTQEQLDKVYDKVVKAYGNRENVTGVDIGFLYDGTKRTDELAVRVHVKEKIPKAALEAEELIPKEIDGVKIDVIQAVYKPHAGMAAASLDAAPEPEPEPEALDRRSRFDILQPGISISHPNVTSGTLGAIVYDRRTRRRGILSNWHVLVGSLSVVPGAPVVQPGRKHGGRVPADRVATLERFMLDRYGDAALALLNADRDAKEQQLESNVKISRARRVKPGEVVEKSGASTGVTVGMVDGVGQYTIEYPNAGSKTISGFKIVAEKPGNPDDLELSAGGDSGSLWYARSDKAGVGLHFAGETDPNPAEENALACHLPDVLERLDITLKPDGPVVPPPMGPDHQSLDDGISAAPGAALPAVVEVMAETIARLTRLLEASSSARALPAARSSAASKPPRRPARSKSSSKH